MRSGGTKYVYLFPAKGAGSLFKHFHLFERWPSLSRDRGLPVSMVGFLSLAEYIRGREEVWTHTAKEHVTVVPTPLGGKVKSGFVALYFIYLSLRYDRVVVHGRKVSAASRLELARRVVGGRLKYVVELESDPVLEAEYAAETDAPSVFYEDTTPAQAKRKQRLTLERADHVITITDELRQRLMERYQDLPLDEKTTAITADFPAEIDFDPAIRAEVRERLGVADRFVYTYIGSAAPVWQNVDRTIEVFSLLSDLPQFDPFLLLLVREVDQDIVEEYIDAAGVPDEDYCLREVPSSEVKGYLYASDIGVMLRDIHPISEVVYGHKYLEYLSAGLPVLTTTVAKWSGELERNDFGIVLEDIDDDSAITRKFAEFKEDEETREQMTRWAREKLDPEPHVDQYVEILRSLGAAG